MDELMGLHVNTKENNFPLRNLELHRVDLFCWSILSEVWN